jgi:hypothetical protein
MHLCLCVRMCMCACAPAEVCVWVGEGVGLWITAVSMGAFACPHDEWHYRHRPTINAGLTALEQHEDTQHIQCELRAALHQQSPSVSILYFKTCSMQAVLQVHLWPWAPSHHGFLDDVRHKVAALSNIAHDWA